MIIYLMLALRVHCQLYTHYTMWNIDVLFRKLSLHAVFCFSYFKVKRKECKRQQKTYVLILFCRNNTHPCLRKGRRFLHNVFPPCQEFSIANALLIIVNCVIHLFCSLTMSLCTSRISTLKFSCRFSMFLFRPVLVVPFFHAWASGLFDSIETDHHFHGLLRSLLPAVLQFSNC